MPIFKYFGVVGSALLALLVHLDGSGVVTFLVTIPAMRPLYDRLGMDRRVLACVASLADPPAISDRMPVRPRCSSLPSQTAPNASGEPNARGRPGTRQNRRENCNRVFVVRPYFRLAMASCCCAGSAGAIGMRRSSVAGTAKTR